VLPPEPPPPAPPVPALSELELLELELLELELLELALESTEPELELLLEVPVAPGNALGRQNV
jgi:hypothetical protein